MTASATALIHRIERLTRERDKARNLRQFYDARIEEAVKQLRECEVGTNKGGPDHESDSTIDSGNGCGDGLRESEAGPE